MLTKITVRNFKRFGTVEVELGDVVVFIGPNNSGKTSALQALALWDIGLKRWNEKRKGKASPEKRPGVTLNRLDLVAIPVPNANLLWHDLHVRDVQRVDGKTKTQNIRIDIIVEGITEGKAWKCGLEFDYGTDQSLYCRPVRLSEGKQPRRMPIPDEAGSFPVAFLPPMSGLAANETRLDPGAVNVRVGEGRTAEILRNLCYTIHTEKPFLWKKLTDHIHSLFGVKLGDPSYITERGEIAMDYEENTIRLDLSSAGRGLQQTLLLLAYMYANTGAVLLLDEPDAHLEILRQRQIYQVMADTARENGNQIVAASHSEVLLNEAAGRDVVVAFVGSKPHRINDRGSQVVKSLRDIGFEDYYLAEQEGWILYLEGSTDLALLRAFAAKLGHEKAEKALARPFVHYVGNTPNDVRKHFHGLREAVPHLRGIAIFDRLQQELPRDLGAQGLTWRRREVENYLCCRETLEAYAVSSAQGETPGPLFAAAGANKRLRIMLACIKEVEDALNTLGKGSPWDSDTKVSDEFLVPLFEKYFKKLKLPNIMEKKGFHELARLVPEDRLDAEVGEKLDAIVQVAETAVPAQ